MTRRQLIEVALVGVLLAAAGCKKKPPAAATAPATEAPPARDPRNTNYEAGAGAVQNVRKAAKRTVTLSEMQQLGQFIEIAYQETGKMPDANRIKADLNPQAGNILAAINDGSILLTGTKDHAGLWAYEVGADTDGGVGLVGPTPQRLDAGQAKTMLGKK